MSIRIRTDGEHSHREDTIERATGFYGRNKTESLLRVANDVPKPFRGMTRAIERDDLTYEQRRELAEQLSTHHFNFDFAFENGEIVASVSPA